MFSRLKLRYTLCAMVEAHAELSVMTLSNGRSRAELVAQLVLRKLNLCPSTIAQIAQTKTRVPHTRTQEGFGSSTASVHAGLLIPLSIAPSAALSKQMRVTSCAAGTAAKQVCVLNRSDMYSASRAIVQFSDCITFAHAFCPSACSSLRPSIASVCFSLQCRYGESLLHGYVSSERSGHPFHVLKKMHVFLDLAMCCGCAVGSSFIAAVSSANHDRVASCMAELLTTSRAVVLVSGWIRPQIAPAYARHPSAASSLRPGAAPVCLACISLQRRYVEIPLQGYLRHVRSQHLVVCRQESTHSLVDIAIASGVPCTCAVRSSFLSATYGAKHLHVASCVPELLTTSRAIVQVSGWIRPPITSAHAICPSACSSLRPSIASVCFSLQCRYGESLLHGYVSSERSGHPFHVLIKMHVFLDLAMCCGCAVGSSFIATVSSASHDRDASCMVGLLTTSRAVVLVSGWIRPQIASAYARHPSAASSLRPGAAPVCLACISLQSRYVEIPLQGYLRHVRSQHLVVCRQESTHSLVDLAIASGVPCTCAVRSSFLSARYGGKHLCVASCVPELLTTSRAIAIVLVSVGICPIRTPRAIRPSAPSSLQPSTALACLSWQCRYEGSLLQGYLKDVLSQRLLVSRQGSKHSLVDLAIASGAPCTCAVRSSLFSAGHGAKHVCNASCMSGLTTSRAIVPVSGRIRPMIASAYAIRASAHRLGADPVWVALQCRYRESASRQEGSHVFLFQVLLLGAGVDLLRSLHRVQAAKRDVVIHSSGCASRSWASPGMTKPSVLVGMFQPASPVPSPRAVYLHAAPARRLAKCLPAAPGSSSRREEHAMVLAVVGLQIQQMFDRVLFRHCQRSQPVPVSGF